MSQVTFTDPATATTYAWPVNPPHGGQTQPAQKQIQIDRASNTGNVGTVKQQGDDGPYIIHWEPLVFHRAHEVALWTWRELSKKQSIYLTDFDGDEYEGQIITLARQKIGVLSGPGDTNGRKFYAKYIFEFEVWNFLSGVEFDAGVLP